MSVNIRVLLPYLATKPTPSLEVCISFPDSVHVYYCTGWIYDLGNIHTSMATLKRLHQVVLIPRHIS